MSDGEECREARRLGSSWRGEGGGGSGGGSLLKKGVGGGACGMAPFGQRHKGGDGGWSSSLRGVQVPGTGNG